MKRTIALVAILLPFLTGCSKNSDTTAKPEQSVVTPKHVTKNESIKVSEREQNEICKIYGYIRNIEKQLRTGRYKTNTGVEIPLMPDKRRELEFVLEVHNESLKTSLRKALGK